MTLREFFVERLKAETPVTLRVLEALPGDGLDYKPHERAPDARQIVHTMSGEFKVCLDVVTDFKGEWTTDPAPSHAEMVATFKRSTDGLIARLETFSDEDWARPAAFHFGGKKVSEQPAGQFLWFILFDSIHHRGQLTTYLRPMGGKVPAIYGPSGDAKS